MLKLSGIVIKGKGKGRILGFPTVNISNKGKELESGVFSGEIIFKNNHFRAAIFVPQNKKTIETHILDFDEDLYGHSVDILLDKKIRETKFFSNDEDLKDQIKEDIEKIKNT